MSKTKPLVVIDTLCVVHKLINFTRTNGELNFKITNKERDFILKAGVDLYNTLYFLPQLTSEDTEIIWVGDSKKIPYWRTIQYKIDLEAGLIPTKEKKKENKADQRSGYKGNRDSCPTQKFAIKKMLSISKALVIPGYEADDIAAAICQTYPDREIYLLTVDSDWLQLVNDKITWLCMTGYDPGYRDLAGLEKWFSRKLTKEPKWVQSEKLDPTKPSEIVRWKFLTGDKSDNLPKGTPIYYYDLKNPPTEHKLWLRPGFREMIEASTRPVVKDNKAYFDWMLEIERDLPTPIYMKN